MYDERFARQYRYEPPSEFPLTSPCTGIVHHLSGPNRYAHTQTSLNCLVGCWCKYPNSHFHCAYRFATRILAHMLDSLVRVSRRVEWNHFVIVLMSGKTQKINGKSTSTHHSAQTLSAKHAWISPKMNSTWHIHSLQANYHVPRVFFKFEPTMTYKARSTTHDMIRTHCCACAATASHHLSMRQSHQEDWFHSLPFQQFQALLTLFSKSFSSFPHGTCLLSVSNQYLAWDEIYHPVYAPIPRNATRRMHAVHGGLQMTNRILTLNDSLFQEAYIYAPVSDASWDYNSKPEATISMLSSSLFIRHY